jgi:acyl-CoA thioester hydrolase
MGGRAVSTLRHRVPFYETDAMGVVHHSNYVRYFELARILWMDEHDRPYREYVAEALHFATTAVEARYHRAARFDDLLDIRCWLERLRGASLRIAYEITRGDERIATGFTEHAMVDGSGRPLRIPRERRETLSRRLDRSG